MQLVENLEDEKLKIEAILPDQVLRHNNTNFFFLNINDGEELLELGDGSGNTSTNVRDLHVIRIVRFQCNCDGACFKKISKDCTDKTCRTSQVQNAERQLQCCHKTGPSK